VSGSGTDSGTCTLAAPCRTFLYAVTQTPDHGEIAVLNTAGYGEVTITQSSAYEPDAVVYCGEELDAAAVEVPNPVIVAEVLCPSTRHVDLSAKLAGYFRVPSVLHYLIVDPAQPLIIHHARQAGDAFLTRVVRDGAITLHPPGIEIFIADVYGATAA
jgi:Uma2 family endonuclease